MDWNSIPIGVRFGAANRRKLASVLAFVIALTSVVMPGKSIAALPLAVLVEPAANFVGGLILSSLARQAVVTVGVAANDASWVVPLANLAARAVSILRIVGLSFTYEIPMQPDVAVPAGSSTESAPSGGALGTYGNPLPYDYPGLSIVVGADVCLISGAAAVDGLVHAIPSGTKFTSSSALLSACTEIYSHSVYPSYAGFSGPAIYNNPYNADPVLVYSGSIPYYVKPIVLCSLHNSNGSTATGIGNCAGGKYSVGLGLSYSLSELPDGIKRFRRTALGLIPDESDPDWTEVEKATFSSPAAVKFVDSASNIVTVAASSSATTIQAVSQSGPDVRVRTAEFSSTAVPSTVNEQTVKNASAADVAAATVASTSSGSGSIVLPTDYARQGEAASAAASIVNALDAPSISSIARPGANKDIPDFETAKKKIDDLPSPDLDWSSLLPHISPGDVVACHPITFEATVNVGPAAGLSSSSDLDLCWIFEIVRNILGWLFGVVTVIYIWRTFTGSEEK